MEECCEALSQGPRAERLLNKSQVLVGVALVGAEKQGLLAAEGVIETAALDTSLARDVRERRATHPFTPKLLECNAQDAFMIELSWPQIFLLCPSLCKPDV